LFFIEKDIKNVKSKGLRPKQKMEMIQEVAVEGELKTSGIITL
jgi:hypothetical protein